MNHLRKQILFLCDSLILIVFSTFFSWFSLRYDLTDAVGQSVQLIQNFALLYACTVLIQLLFLTYDSLGLGNAVAALCLPCLPQSGTI